MLKEKVLCFPSQSLVQCVIQLIESCFSTFFNSIFLIKYKTVSCCDLLTEVRYKWLILLMISLAFINCSPNVIESMQLTCQFVMSLRALLTIRRLCHYWFVVWLLLVLCVCIYSLLAKHFKTFHITNFPCPKSNIPASSAYCVFISQLIPYVRDCSSYESFILKATRLSNNRDTSRNAWNRNWRCFMVDTGTLSNNTKFLSHECLMTFCILTKYNDNPPPIGLYTNPWPFYRTRPFTALWKVSNDHRTFATGVACWQGMFTPPDTWSRPIWDLHMLYLLRPILFTNLS